MQKGSYRKKDSPTDKMTCTDTHTQKDGKRWKVGKKEEIVNGIIQGVYK